MNHIVTVCEPNKCTGCMACVVSCPKDAICLSTEFSGYSAVINTTKCVNCHRCEHVCQVHQRVDLLNPIKWYQGWSKDEHIRSTSASGGIATALVYDFIKNGGVVCCCVFKNGEFCFEIIEHVDFVTKIQGSKYVKSSLNSIYVDIKEILCARKKLLFIGLPCQVAAVKLYLGDQLQNNLYTIDLICHGTPIPSVLEAYLAQYGIQLDQLSSINFRSNNDFRLSSDEIKIGIPCVKDAYMISYLNGISYTENCYNCIYSRLLRNSDITLGDSWGSELSTEAQSKGISLILCQTQKGAELLIRADLVLKDVDIERAIVFNHQLSHPMMRPAKRAKFLASLTNNKKFNHIVFHCYPKQYFKQIVKSVIYKKRKNIK